MVPYEVQPVRYHIRFTDIDPTLTSAQFLRDLMVAKQLGITEERYYQDKLESTLFNDDFYNPNLPMESLNQLSSI
jgi:hypothetical protein